MKKRQDHGDHAGGGVIDQGWAWVITAAVFGSNILCVGYYRAYSVFFVEIVDTYQTTSSIASLIFGVQNAVFCVSALLVHNVLLEVVTVRTSAVIGGFLMATGMAMATLASSMGVLIVFISVIVGIGNAMTYGPGLVLLGQYFDKRRALAVSMGSMGSSVGSMTMALLATSVLQLYGLRGAWLLYGAITLNLCVFTSLYRPLKHNVCDSNSTHCDQDKALGHDFTGDESVSGYDLVTDGAPDSEHKVQLCLEPSVAEKEANDALKGVAKNFNSSGGNPASDRGGVSFPIAKKDPERVLPRLIVSGDTATKDFSSTGDIYRKLALDHHHAELSSSSKDVDKLLPRRSLTVGDLAMGDHHRLGGSRGSVRSLSSDLQGRLKNIMMHAGHPHLMIQSPSVNYLHQDDHRGHESASASGDKVNTGDFDEADSSKTCKSYFAKFACDSGLLQNPVFWLIQVYVCCGVIGSSGGGAYLPALCQERGLNPSETAVVLTTWGGVNLVGRLLVGLVADRRWLRPARISALAFLGIGTLFQLLRFFPRDSLRAMLSVGVLYGLFEAAYFTMLPVIIIDFLSLKHFSRTFGCAQLSQGAFAAAIFPVLGALRDETGDYLATYHTLGACALVAASLLLLEPVVRAMRKRQSRENGV